MFLGRLILFAWAATWLESWIVLALALTCHGGGFGQIPLLAAKANPDGDPRFLGIVLTAWGIGGVIGVALTMPFTLSDPSFAMRSLSVVMAAGTIVAAFIRFDGYSSDSPPARGKRHGQV